MYSSYGTQQVSFSISALLFRHPFLHPIDSHSKINHIIRGPHLWALPSCQLSFNLLTFDMPYLTFFGQPRVTTLTRCRAGKRFFFCNCFLMSSTNMFSIPLTLSPPMPVTPPLLCPLANVVCYQRQQFIIHSLAAPDNK